MRAWVLLWVWVIGFAAAVTSEWTYEGATITLANLNISYVDPSTGHHSTNYGQVGKFGTGAVGVASGMILVGHAAEAGINKYNRYGCTTPWAVVPPSEPWVALVARGQCPDSEKVANALSLNASAILVYAKDTKAHLQKIALSTFSRHVYGTALQRLRRYPAPPATDQLTDELPYTAGEHRGVVVFLGHEQGEELARMVENGTKVYVSITQGQDVKFRLTNINSVSLGQLFVTHNPVCDHHQAVTDCVTLTSVLFVSVSFIILMVISLAWLVFYYIQRFRYIHAKDRLARHLCNAAKKALAKIPVKNLKSGDKEVSAESECCAVCIEPYQVSDTVRTLPCKHQFHKNCVDPWLLEHRTCPMCKMDILKYYGFVLSDSEESVLQIDALEENSGGDVEARVPTPPPPANPRTSHISQVMVVPRAESSGGDTLCEDSESPIPDTPISPVHQPQSTIPPCSATSSGLLSMISSARTRACLSAKLSQSSQITPSSATSQASRPPTPQIDKEVHTEETGNSQGCACIRSQNKNDVEVSSVCSDDFSDALSTQSAADVETGPDCVGKTNQDPNSLNNAANCMYVATCEHPASAPFCVSDSTGTPSVPPSAQTRSPPQTGSPTHKESASRKRSASWTRSSPKKRSASRGRSTSRRRSASRGRSPSRGRSNTRQESPTQPRSAATSRVARKQSRPSSHVISVSHV
ncbi:uncharacterized protein [Panulirus ornatus]|uniref:uncharacterized protein isoform X2 n=1 Tax=Panulirus ornatus TaxID=150431 RepID=UPI003A87C8F6